MDNREEHLSWCKQRALELVELGELKEALNSIYSDLRKHPKTINHPGIIQGYMLQQTGRLETEKTVRAFIEQIL